MTTEEKESLYQLLKRIESDMNYDLKIGGLGEGIDSNEAQHLLELKAEYDYLLGLCKSCSNCGPKVD